jgi:hypothetical protein
LARGPSITSQKEKNATTLLFPLLCPCFVVVFLPASKNSENSNLQPAVQATKEGAGKFKQSFEKKKRFFFALLFYSALP